MANGGSGSPLAIELSDINKSFGDVHANRNVSLTVVPGHIHGIIGENGAGKSTLVSILYGFYGADSGTIRINGETTTIRNSADAIGKGIGMVHQHFMLVPNFTVLENVMLGREGSLSVETGARKAREALNKLSQDFGLAVDPDMIVEDLPVGLQQRVEILKALFRGAEILILDEPTGVLTPQETEQLFDILRALRKQGVTILLITHKLKEIMAITDDVSVMRGGEMVAHLQTADTSPAELAELMVGRKVLLEVDHTPARPGAPVLDVQDLCLTDAAGIDQLKQISMTLREGEIVGIAGVSGNGQSELLDVLSGIMAPTGGHFTVGTNQITAERASDPAELRDFGVAHVPEDRHKCGIVLPFSAAESMILGYSGGDEEDGGWWLSPSKLEESCAGRMREFDIRPPIPKLQSANFSGGNQQKVVLAKWLQRNADVIIFDEPTRGIDVGAKYEIYQLIHQLADDGKAILMISSELPEILGMSDRILVMNEGRLTGEITEVPRASQEDIMKLATQREPLAA